MKGWKVDVIFGTFHRNGWTDQQVADVMCGGGLKRLNALRKHQAEMTREEEFLARHNMHKPAPEAAKDVNDGSDAQEHQSADGEARQGREAS